jgi:hypothetical protein
MSPTNRKRIRRIAATKGPRHQRARLWYAIRTLRSFTVSELLAVAEVDDARRKSVLAFLSQLRRVGFLRAQYGNRGRHEATHFRLIRDPGPLTPAVVDRGTAVWDPNSWTRHIFKESSNDA